ncbi:MAG TPA: hypothetical protein VFU81_14890, partial [Thermomicrobiales bacterium]|nr:hypothetical protein [Thermomicrobiales bacterium]
MATHRLRPSLFFNTLGSHEPVLRIADGDRVIAATLDASGVDGDGAVRAPRPNPMTGPIFVEGAEPGDALHVTIENLRPNRATGWSRATLAPNVVDPDAVPSLPPRHTDEWAIDAAAGTVRLLGPDAKGADLVLPLAPMIGCFGVA